MRNLVAVAVVFAVGCSSTTNVTNVYVGEDASSEAGDAVIDSHVGTAPGDAVADSVRDADAATPFTCVRASVCPGEPCCALISHDGTGATMVDETLCAPSCTLSTGVPTPASCGTNSDCAAPTPMCCKDALSHGWCAASC